MSPTRTSRNVAAAALAQVAGKVSTLIWTLVAVRQMTQSEFGSFNFALSVALLISACAEWGFDAVLVQRSSRQPDQLERRYAEAVVWQSAVALPLFVGAGVVVGLVRPEAQVRTTVALLLLAVFLELWSDTARSVAAAARDQTATSAALVLQRLATMALAIPVLLAGGGTVGLAAVFLVTYALGWVAHRLALRRLGVHFRWGLVTRAGMRAFVTGTWALGVSGLVLMALFRIDALLLAAISGDAALGSYSAAYRLFETALFLVFAVTGAVYPLMSARPDDDEVVRGGIESGLAAVSAVYLPLAAVCLVDAPGVLDLLFGSEYARTAAGALRWLSLAPLAYAAAYLASAALAATSRTRGLLIGALVALVVNVALNVALLPRFAGTGAGFATTASYTVEAVVLLAAVGRVSGRVRIGRALAVPAVAAAALGAGLLTSPLPSVVEVPLGVVGYAGLWLLLTARVNPEQLAVLRGVLPARRGSAP